MRGLASVLSLVLLAALPAVRGQVAPTYLYRDVAIIGGGAAGAYSAIAAKQDYGLSVVVIEKTGELGGHVDSYTDPATGRSFEYGVQNYINVTGALRHFNRLGVPMQLNVRSTNVQRNVDFSTGVELTGYVPPAAADRTAALNKFVDLTEQWRTRMEPGYHNFWPAGQVPEDLLLPFGEWVVKHNLTAAVPTFFSTTGFGTDDLLAKPTLGVIRSINPDLILTLLGRLNSLIPVSRRNQDIYDRSRVVIGDQDILFDSTVVTSNLPCNGAQGNATLFVQNARTGAITVVVAKRVIFTAVPSEANLAPFAIRQETKNLLSKLTYSTVYAAVVSHQSLPVNTTLVNVRSAAVPDNYLNSIPRAPFNTRFEQYADSSYYRAVATGDAGFTANQAKNVMQQALDKMIQAGTIPQSRIILPLYFNAFESHGLMSAQLSSDKIRDGVWNQIEAENGKCGVHWTGATFGVVVSTNLWQDCEYTLRRVKDSI